MTDQLSRNAKAVLEERARALARPAEAVERHEGSQVVVLSVGGERYGVDIRLVREVQRASPPTPVPGVPAFWAGVANVRGSLYPVLDLARYMGLGNGGGGMLVLVSAAGLDVALLVDEVPEARELPPGEVRRPAGGGSDPWRRAIRGITADLLSVLDLDAMLSDPQLTVDRQAG